METVVVDVAPKLLEHGVLGIVVLLQAVAIVYLFRALIRVQELRVAEARATADALNKAADKLADLAELVKGRRP